VLEKDSPPEDRLLVEALTTFEEVVMVIWAFCQAASLIGPVTDPSVAVHPENVTVPKSARGSTLPPEGASVTHSALDRTAFLEACVVEKDFPFERSWMVSTNFPEPMKCTDAWIVFPGVMERARFTGSFGYISYQA
jgi:hypothetical protein